MTHGLYLGVKSRNITPPVGGYLYGYPKPPRSTSVNDDLTVTALYLCEGDTHALLLSFTICSLATPLCERLAALLEEKTGVPRASILLHATHTHSGPSTTNSVGWGEADGDYIEGILIPAAIAAAKEAMAAPRHARLAVATGECLLGINRRQLVDGQACLGQRPGGTQDTTMTVLGFFGDDGAPLATAVHYAAHCTASGKNSEITRDWAGVMIDALAESTHAPVLFLQGPEGDIGPRMPSGKTIGEATVKDALAIGKIAARDAVRIYGTLATPEETTLRTSQRTLALPLAKRPSRAEAEAMLQKYEGFTAGVEATTADYCRRVLASYRDGYSEVDCLPITQTLLTLGDTVLVSFPYELFSEIGLRIKEKSPFTHTLSLALTGGAEAYFVTEREIPYRGYEVDMFLLGNVQPYPKNADSSLVELTLTHLLEMKTKPYT
jgi:hypothetical protein